MKIIFSRKGFDASAGGVASPIMPSGALCSLPIPEPGPGSGATRYGDVRWKDEPLAKIVADLTRGKVGAADAVHLDPDLDAGSRPRAAGWRPLFGQANAAEGHLRNQGVGPGDIFLFYGWFREVEQVRGRYRYVAGSPDLHVLFGWLQVAQRIPVTARAALPGWAATHPHYSLPPYGKKDAIYVANERLEIPGLEQRLPGGGLFSRFQRKLQLTAPGETRRVWQLPGWLHPDARDGPLSYHRNPARWRTRGEHTLLQTTAPGQEFVLDGEAYPQAIAWIRTILERAAPAA